MVERNVRKNAGIVKGGLAMGMVFSVVAWTMVVVSAIQHTVGLLSLSLVAAGAWFGPILTLGLPGRNVVAISEPRRVRVGSRARALSVGGAGVALVLGEATVKHASDLTSVGIFMLVAGVIMALGLRAAIVTYRST
jgi:hypothetical protein